MTLRSHREVVHKELQTIRAAHGLLTPALVVDAARPAEHPLHGHFQWDDGIAAEAWRREQARKLIRSVRVTYSAGTGAETHSVRAYHAVRTSAGHAFDPTEEIIEDPFRRRLILNDMRRDWETLKRRYEHFAEFVEMIRQDPDVA